MAQPASFSRVRFGSKASPAASLLLGLASSAVILLGGCDTDSGKADKAVSAQLDTASMEMTGTDAQRATANKELGDAARQTATTLPQQLRAKSLLGDSELQMAQEAVAKILANDVQIDRLTREIDLLGNQIESNNQMFAALGNYDPSKLQDTVTAKKAEVTGSATVSDWYTLKTLTADDAQMKDLQGKIADVQGKIKTDSDNRNQLLDQADKLTQQSQHEVKQKSVDLYVQGSNLRKQAADLTVTIDNNSAILAQYQADLAVWQGQHDAATAAGKALDDKSAAFDEDWKAIQAEQAKLSADSKAILGDDPVNAPAFDKKNGDLTTDATIGSKAAAIANLAKDNAVLRSTAETHFNAAIGKYSEAAALAVTLRSNLGDLLAKAGTEKPDRAAWTQEQETLAPATYQFLQADAELQRAEFYARSGAEAKVRLDMIAQIKPVIADAKLTSYPSLDDSDGKIEEQLKGAQKSARDSFKSSSDLLVKIPDTTLFVEHQRGARVQNIFAQYGWSLLELAAGDPQQAGIHLEAAKSAVKDCVENGDAMPPLPSELAPVESAKSAPGAGRATPPAPAGGGPR